MRALIVEDGYGPHPLAATRALGRAGWSVGIGSPQRLGRAVRSRWAKRWHLVPPAESGVADFAAATARAVTLGGYDIVFGGDDVEVLALTACRDEIGTVVPHAEHTTVRAAIDKVHLTDAARRVGLATPRTSGVARGRLPRPPVVIKARLHWSPGMTGVPPRLSPVVCTTEEEVDGAVDLVVRAGGEAVAQEVVHGTLMAFTAVIDGDGRTVARVQQRALRQSPEWRNSVRAETVPVDQDLSRRVEALLGELGWFGLANLQFLVPSDGVPRLIDLNGRFYGSMALAVAAGVNLPLVWATVALGSPAPGATEAQVGVRYQALEEDLRRAWAERRGGAIADVVDCLRFAPTAVHSTWSSDDPGPALTRSREVLRSAVRGVASRAHRGDGRLG